MRSMGFLFFLFITFPLFSDSSLSYLRLTINPQILEVDEINWSEEIVLDLDDTKPMTIKFEGLNFKMMFRFSWKLLNNDSIYVTVQSETLIKNQKGQIEFYSNLKSLETPLGSEVLYFPLGGKERNNLQEPVLRIVLILNSIETEEVLIP